MSFTLLDAIGGTPLVEIRQGQGTWLVCQLQVATKLQIEPVARQLFKQMLNYLTTYTPPVGRSLYYPSGLVLSDFNGSLSPMNTWDELNYPDVRLLVVGSGAANLSTGRMDAFIRSGGTILWDRPNLTQANQ